MSFEATLHELAPLHPLHHGHLLPTPSSSSSIEQGLPSSNMLHEIRVPLSRDHGPHGRATVPVLGVTTTRDQGQGYNIPRLHLSNLTPTIMLGKLRLHDASSFGYFQHHLEFTSTITYEHICCILFKSGTLDIESLHQLISLGHAFQQLHLAISSTSIQASTFNASSVNILDLAIACDFYIPLVISCLRGEFTGDYRDPTAIIHILQEHACPEYIINDIHRVYTIGAPAQFKYSSSTSNLVPFIQYGNHSSADKYPDLVMQTITKELDRSYAIGLPQWAIPFIVHLHLSPLGLLVKEGKEPRLIIDHSFEPTIQTVCVNRMHRISTEIAIEYGTALLRHLTRIANLRISYPSTPIYLFDTDVTGAFRHVKYNLFIASAFSYATNGLVIIPTAQDFGSTTSPSNYEPLALGHAWLSQAYSSSNHSHLLSKHAEYLDMIQFQHTEGSSLASLIPDPLNNGVLVLGMPINTPHIPFVDDNLMADTLPRIPQAIVGNIESCFQHFGTRNDTIRPCPLSLKKLRQAPCSPIRTQLGVSIDTNALTVGLPVEKHLKLQQLMSAFHLHRKTCSILDGAQLLGFLEHIGTYLPWFRHLYGNIRESFNDALRKSSKNIEHTDAYISCLHSIKHLEGTDLQYHMKYLAKMKAKAIYTIGGHHPNVRITTDFRQDLNLILALASDITLWTTPIPHIIPRTPNYTAFCDSCSYGAGGYCSQSGFMWHFFWP